MQLWAEQLRSALRGRVEGDIARRLGVPPAENGRPPSVDLAARFHWADRNLRP